VDGQHIIHAYKVLAGEALQRGDITEEIYRETFCTRKVRFVGYKKPHVYIGMFVQINESHFKQMHYTTMLEDFMKLCRIWKAHDQPSAESRVEDKKCSKCLVEAAKAVCMKFKARKHKG
jgi:hypothetical protein